MYKIECPICHKTKWWDGIESTTWCDDCPQSLIGYCFDSRGTYTYFSHLVQHPDIMNELALTNSHEFNGIMLDFGPTEPIPLALDSKVDINRLFHYRQAVQAGFYNEGEIHEVH